MDILIGYEISLCVSIIKESFDVMILFSKVLFICIKIVLFIKKFEISRIIIWEFNCESEWNIVIEN